MLGPGPGLVHVAKDFKTIDVCLTTLIVAEPVVVWKDQADPAAEGTWVCYTLFENVYFVEYV